MLRVKVRNMEDSRGNTVPNQFIVDTDQGTYFQSYNTVIAFRERNGQIFLDSNAWDYSTTTSKYRNAFLGETKKETEAKIKDGTYKLTAL